MAADLKTIRAKSRDTFAALLQEFEAARPRRGSFVTGTVLQVLEDAIYFDIGTKQDAVLSKQELGRTDPELLATIEPGVELPLFVLSAARGSKSLEVSIERAREVEDWNRAQSMLKEKESVEIVVNGYNAGGLTADFGRIQGFIPNSHVPALRRVARDQQQEIKRELIGARMLVRIIEVDQKQNRLVISARKARSAERQRRLKELKQGEVIEGVVVNIVDFGAFIDLGGVEGLLHISEIDHQFVDHPSKFLNVQDRLEVFVKNVDLKQERVSLSRKALLPSPWEIFARTHAPGDLIVGQVSRLQRGGLYVLLPEGIEGFIRPEELGIGEEGSSNGAFQPGETIVSRIDSIESEKQQLLLSLRSVTYAEEQAQLAALASTVEPPAEDQQED